MADLASVTDRRPDADVTEIRSGLTDCEWSFRDERYRGVVLVAGRGRVSFEGADLPFVAPCLIWLPASRTARLIIEAGTRGMALALTELGLARSIPAGADAVQIRAALARPTIASKLEPHQARRLAEALEAILDEGSHDRPGAQDCVKHHLAIFYIATWRLSGPVPRESPPLPAAIVHRFLHAVELHLREHWTTTQYASEVGVSADQLNAALRRATGRSARALIHERLVLEAEALLDNSRLQIREIAEELGFSDAAYFSRFYKRHTGGSPKRQRRGFASPKDAVAASFAAWP